jgi:hypothetical protein
MKLLHYLILISLFTALSFIVPDAAYGRVKFLNGEHKYRNDNKHDDKNDNNEQGREANRGNDNERRYRYHGQDYNFHDYYHFYRVENNVFTFEGTYGKHSDVFIFTDRYGNEFDLYVKPVYKTSRWFKGHPMQIGDAYNIRINPARMYPNPEELRLGINFSFGWGNLTLQNNRYFDMYTAPELVNVNGRLFIN